MSIQGQCKICKNTYTKGGFSRHLNNCIAELGKFGEAKAYEERNAYLIQITDAYKPKYFLYVLVDVRSTLKLMDDFLRKFWLECCGHLSQFKMDGVRYTCYDNENGLDYRLGDILGDGMSMDYTYDFGSETNLKLDIKRSYHHIHLKNALTIVAQNDPVSRDPYNSPRTGVCGYEGNNDFDPSVLKVDDYSALASEGLIDDDTEDGDVEEFLSSLANCTEEEVYQKMSNAFMGLIKDQEERQKKKALKYYLKSDKTDLRSCLSMLSKQDLALLSKSFHLSRTSSLKKQELLDVLVTLIPDKFGQRLAYFTSETFDMIKKSVKHDGVEMKLGDYDFELGSDLFNFIERTMLFPVAGPNGKVFILPDELKLVFKEEDTAFLKRQVISNSKVMDIIYGAIYYYGLINLPDLEDLLSRLNQSVSAQILDSIFYLNKEVNDTIEIRDNYIVHRDLRDHNQLLRDILKREDQFGYQDHKPFSLKELTQASEIGFYKRTQAIINLERYLKYTYEMSNQELEMFTRDLLDTLDEMEGREDSQPLVDFLSSVFEFPSLDILNEMLMFVMDVRNNHREWLLKGYAPEELMSKEDHSHPLFHEEYIRPVKVEKKVKIGRNEPCPCGSGKKYKRCCGRN